MRDLAYLKLLAREYPTVKAASSEIINLMAIRGLPKGTEYFFSDLHGEYEAFIHLLRSASGIIREKIFLNYSQEIPYSCEVSVEEFKEGHDRYDIGAVIYVMRESQKGILIGKGGLALKKVGTQARIDMEDFFQKKIFLRLFVKVDPDWRENKRELKKFGYEF